MKKLLFRNGQSLGDIVMLTAAVRDLHRCYPGKFVTDVRTSCPELWLENPYLTPLEEDGRGVEIIDCHYPLIAESNRVPRHFLFGFIDFLNERLGLQIEPTAFHGDIHLHESERQWMPQVMERTRADTPYWILVAGGKYDYTIKWWDAGRWQRIVDHFRDRIAFVQVGREGHYHPALDGVIDLRGRTDLRQLIRLVYHAQGVVCPVTGLMHLAAAVPVREGRPQNRACVVVAGGREPAQWEAYPHHQFIHTNGQLLCCDQGGCWKARTMALGDGDEKDGPAQLCVQPIEVEPVRWSLDGGSRSGRSLDPPPPFTEKTRAGPKWRPAFLPRCMEMITAAEVIRRIEGYFAGGAYQYLTAQEVREAERAMTGGKRPTFNGEHEAKRAKSTGSRRSGRKLRMIGVTIGVGEKWELLARLAMESFTASTEFEGFVLGEEAMHRYGLTTPHHLKYKLFHEFPEADVIVYFDADVIFLQPFEARLFAGRREFVCVRDAYEREHCIREEARSLRLRPELYFNSGFFIVQRAHHSVFLEKAQWLTGRHFSRFKDQTFLNGARHMLGAPILYLPREYNALGFDSSAVCDRGTGFQPVGPASFLPAADPTAGMAACPDSRDGCLPTEGESHRLEACATPTIDDAPVVIGHFHLIDERPLETIEAYHRAWQARGREMAARHGAQARAKLRALLATAPPVPRRPAPAEPARAEERRYRVLLEAEVAAKRPYPRERFAGRGIVICGGGVKYFPCAWVAVKLLRHHGCKLPIELWHIGPNEMSPAMRALLTPLGVRTVDGLEVRQRHPVPSLRGWELKSYALLHCRFAEVLLLDADNAPVHDPSFLFEELEYREKGAIFWPDFWKLAEENPIWRIMGVPYREEPAFESGQIVVDKRQCWKALRLAGHLNEQSAWYYRFIHGDKDTFHMAWARLDQPYAMPDKRLEALEATMCQHDLHGRRLFQHRNSDKWRIDGRNRTIPGFKHETLCRRFLEELRRRWFPVTLGVRRWEAAEAPPGLRATARALIRNIWDYHRVGYDRRPLRLRADGLVGRGGAAQEFYWHLRPSPSGPVLEFFSATARTCYLLRGQDGVWRGRWEACEKMPIELKRLPVQSPSLKRPPIGKSRQSGDRKTRQNAVSQLPSHSHHAREQGRGRSDHYRKTGKGGRKSPKALSGASKANGNLPVRKPQNGTQTRKLPGSNPRIPKAIGVSLAGPSDKRKSGRQSSGGRPKTGKARRELPASVPHVGNGSRRNCDKIPVTTKIGQVPPENGGIMQKTVNCKTVHQKRIIKKT